MFKNVLIIAVSVYSAQKKSITKTKDLFDSIENLAEIDDKTKEELVV